jgi:exonuclease III
MSDNICPIFCWNVRGLNNLARRLAVCELATSARAVILCLQETKLDLINDSLACEIAGPSRRSFFFLPADGTRGGVALFWDPSIVHITNPSIRQFSISASVTILSSGASFTLSTVYGPAEDAIKPTFLQEMKDLVPSAGEPWLIAGDFNLIYEARDKNNDNLCRRLMGQFRAALNQAELFELRCSNRKFSWSNERELPTLVNLDRIFCNAAWDAIFSPCAVQALSTSHSDHCP